MRKYLKTTAVPSLDLIKPSSSSLPGTVNAINDISSESQSYMVDPQQLDFLEEQEDFCDKEMQENQELDENLIVVDFDQSSESLKLDENLRYELVQFRILFVSFKLCLNELKSV